MPFQDVIPIFHCLLYMFYMCFTIFFLRNNVSKGISFWRPKICKKRCQRWRSSKTSKFLGPQRWRIMSDNQNALHCPWRIHGTIVYLSRHEGLILMVNVGEYTSPMDPMGWLNQKKTFFSGFCHWNSHLIIPQYLNMFAKTFCHQTFQVPKMEVLFSSSLSGGFIFFIVTPVWGRWTHVDEYFSKGLKPPTRSYTSISPYVFEHILSPNISGT